MNAVAVAVAICLVRSAGATQLSVDPKTIAVSSADVLPSYSMLKFRSLGRDMADVANFTLEVTSLIGTRGSPRPCVLGAAEDGSAMVECNVTITEATTHSLTLLADGTPLGMTVVEGFVPPTPLYVRPTEFALDGGNFFTVKLNTSLLPVQDTPRIRFARASGTVLGEVVPEVVQQGGYIFFSGRSPVLSASSTAQVSDIQISYTMNGDQFTPVLGEIGVRMDELGNPVIDDLGNPVMEAEATISAQQMPPFKIGYLMHQAIALENGYTYWQNMARLSLPMVFGERVDASDYLDSLVNWGPDVCGDHCEGPNGWCSTNPDCPEGLTHASYVEGRRMIEERGVDMVVGITFEYWSDMEQLAKEFPDKKFLQTSPGAGTLTPNFARFLPKQHQAVYMIGYALGQHPFMRANPRAGYVAAVPELKSNQAAFAKGFRDAAGPGSKLYVIYTSDWGNPRREKIAAERLFKYYNISAFATICNTLEGNWAAQRYGRYSAGLNLDVMSVVGPSTLVSMIQSYDKGVQAFVRSAMAGVPWGDSDLEDAGMESPPVLLETGRDQDAWHLSSFSTEMPAASRKRIAAREAEFKAGLDDVFCNVVHDPNTNKVTDSVVVGGALGECPDQIDWDILWREMGIEDTCSESEKIGGFCYIGVMNVTSDVPDACPIGYTITAEGCQACPPGMESNRDGADDSMCLPCAEGSFTAGQAALCAPCAAGSFSSERGSSQCQLSEPGRFVPDKGASASIECQEGTVASEAGSTECEPCERGTYQPDRGQPSCIPCPSWLTTQDIAARSRDKCIRLPCEPGTFLSQNETLGCLPCPQGCDGPGAGCECPGGDSPPKQSAGFRAGRPAVEGGAVEFLVKCKDTATCPGGTDLGTCPATRDSTSLSCDICEVDYFEDSDSQCVSCTESFNGTPLLLTILIGIAGGFVMYFFATREVGVQSMNALTVTLSFTLMLNMMQLLGSFREISLEWPEPLKTVYNAMRVFTFGLDFLRPGCVFKTNDSVFSYAGTLLTYPVFATMVVVIFFAARYLPPPIGKKGNFNQLMNSQGLVFLMFYISLSVVALRSLHCERNPDGSSSVVAYRSVICWSTSDHVAMVVFSAFGILVYSVGFLAIVCYASLKYPTEVVRSGGDQFIKRYCFLFNRFTTKCYYYGIVYCGRNLLVALLPVIFVGKVSAQLALVALVLVACIGIQCHLWPWRTSLPNVLDAMGSMCLVVILMGGATLVDADRSESKDIVQIFFVLLLIFLALLIISVLSFAMYRIIIPYKAFGVFLCHHKEGGSVLARWFKLELGNKTFDGIFLDSDMLDRLDQIFEITAHQTKNLVVILTKETLRRIWCAGEITSAVRANVNTIPVACTGFEPLSDVEIDGIAETWTVMQTTEVARLGVEIPHIQDAYRVFRKLEHIHMDRHTSQAAQLEVIDKLHTRCTNLSMKLGAIAAGKTNDFSDHGIVILTDRSNSEAMALSSVLQCMLQRVLQSGVTIAAPERDAARKQFHGANFLLVLLVRGALESADFASALVAARQFEHLDLVSVVGDEGFLFPDPAFWERLRRGEVVAGSVSSGRLHRVEKAYQALFNILALRFSPRGSADIQRTEVSQMAPRFQAGLKAGGAAGHGEMPPDDEEMSDSGGEFAGI